MAESRTLDVTAHGGRKGGRAAPALLHVCTHLLRGFWPFLTALFVGADSRLEPCGPWDGAGCHLWGTDPQLCSG